MTTITLVDFNLTPAIVLGTAEHRLLTALATAGAGDFADPADSLLQELERASVVPDASVPADVVRMNSTVVFRTLGGEERSVQLVFPKDADIAEGRISVLTPAGTALIGLKTGDSITWAARDGRKQMLTVLSVQQPGADDPGDDPGPLAA
jgi:regulator of nucleoside diphosphate kinase